MELMNDDNFVNDIKTEIVKFFIGEKGLKELILNDKYLNQFNLDHVAG